MVRRSYELAGMLFGVRSNSNAAGAWLDDTLGDYRLADDEADPYFSILVGENGRSLGKRFHILYRESQALIRTLDLAELGRVFLAELEALTFRRRDDAVYVKFPLVSRDGAAALVPPELPSFLDRIARKVAGTGIYLPRTEFTAIDLDSGLAIPIRRSLSVGDDELGRFSRIAAADGRSVPRWAPTEPLRVDAVCTMQYFEETPIQPLSRAAALHALVVNAANFGSVGRAGLRALALLVEQARCYRLMADFRDEMLSYVVTVLDKAHNREAVGAPTP